jgi:GNAT superfamily N-acetyltransferase
MNVRAATAADVMAIAEVHVRGWQEAYVGQMPQAHLDSLSVERRAMQWTETLAATDWPAQGILVLEDDGAVVGFASICPWRHDGEDSIGEVAGIYLRQAAWGRGGGRALMSAALASLAAAGFTTAMLWVLDTNTRARTFYEAGGWTADGGPMAATIGGQKVTEVRYRRPLP